MSPDDRKEVTITGRLPRQPEIQFLKPPSYLREIMEILAKCQQEVSIITGLDRSSRGDSTGAMFIRYVDGHMEVEHITSIQGKKADLVIIDDVAEYPDYAEIEKRMLAMYPSQLLIEGGVRHGKTEVMRELRVKDPVVKKAQKPNKDKGYLALDPTKNHRKRRR